jgi:hypothetical protein
MRLFVRVCALVYQSHRRAVFNSHKVSERDQWSLIPAPRPVIGAIDEQVEGLSYVNRRGASRSIEDRASVSV